MLSSRLKGAERDLRETLLSAVDSAALMGSKLYVFDQKIDCCWDHKDSSR